MQEGRQPERTSSSILDNLGPLIAVALVLGILPAAAGSTQLPHPLDLDDRPVLILPSPIGTVAYTPGRGLHLGDTRVTLGGYSNINLVREEGSPATLKLDDLSFFVICDPTPRFHLFSELEFEDLADINDTGHGGTANHIFTAERLYGDLTVSDRLNVRVGKFLTPVGRWNVIHAQPLVWTTSRPLATSLPFDPHTTGAMLFGSLFPNASSLTYSVFGQFVNQLDPNSEPPLAYRSAGARLEYAGSQLWSVGSSYLSFSHAGQWEHLVGVDGIGQYGPLEMMGEAVFTEATGGLGTQWGFYLQSVTQVASQLYVVGRYEHFAQRAAPRVVNLITPGVAYKLAPYIILKAEYLIADHPAEESPPGFKSSFAILF